MAEPCNHAKYLVLHFHNGLLCGTKITRTWRGALMSKRNHERPYNRKILKEVFHYNDAQIDLMQKAYSACTRILPIEAVLALQGLEKPDTDLSAEDMALLNRMGIA
jgi:hypothetical protein